jgi:hypothetical protein
MHQSLFKRSLLPNLVNSLSWSSFLLLREIVNISFASEIDSTSVDQFTKLVNLYLTTFDNAYGNIRRIPKHHLLVHLVEQMRRFGPLRFSSCLIFEKKHAYLKRVKYRNFVNISFSLARRHQEHIAGQMMACSDATSASFLYTGHIIKRLREVDDFDSVLAPTFDANELVYEAEMVRLFGITYSVDDVILTNETIFPSDPVFGKITSILVQQKQIVFRVQIAFVVNIHQPLVAYEISFLDCTITKSVFELRHVWPVRSLKIDNSIFVCLFPYGRSLLA